MNRPHLAIKSFDRVIAGKPDFTQVHLLRAKLLMDLGRHDAALKRLDDFVAKFPNLPEAWFGRSTCCSPSPATTLRSPTPIAH
jgi:predicted Zn-dependent protease